MFDIERFKAGEPALTYQGNKVYFVAYVPEASHHYVVRFGDSIATYPDEESLQEYMADMAPKVLRRYKNFLETSAYHPYVRVGVHMENDYTDPATQTNFIKWLDEEWTEVTEADLPKSAPAEPSEV